MTPVYDCSLYEGKTDMNVLKINRKTLVFCILVTLILGMLVHGYMLSNKFYNHDDLDKIVGDMNVIETGRWFLFAPAYLETDFFTTPWMGGLLGFLYLSIVIYIIANLFDISNKLVIALLTLTLIAWPSLAATMQYTRFFSPYMFAFMLTMLALYFAIRLRYAGIVFAIPLLVLSLGIYQAYIGFYLSIALLWLVREIMQRRGVDRQIIWTGVKTLFVLALSVLVYTIITKRMISSLAEGAAYQGIDKLGRFDFENLLQNLTAAYTEFYQFLLSGESTLLPDFLKIAALLSIIIFLVYIVFHVCKLSFLSAASVLLLILLLPFGISVFYFMGIAEIHILVKFSVIMYVLMPLLFAADALAQKNLWKKLFIVVLVFVSLLDHSNVKLINSVYMQLQIAQKNSDAYTARLLNRIESVKDYDSYDEVVLIGDSSLSTELHALFAQSNFQNIVVSEIGVSNMHSFVKYLRYFQGFHNVMHSFASAGSIDTLMRLKDADMESILAQISEMPSYPSDGSIIRLEQGVVVVKFSDEY